MDCQDRSSPPHREGSILLGALGAQESSRLAAFDLLPEEIIVFVFRLVVEPDPPTVGLLLLVSRYWRYIVQMTPSLWSRILIMPQKLGDFTGVIQYVEAAYANSANLPLDMIVNLPNLTYASHFTKVPPNPSESQIPVVNGGDILHTLLRVVLGREGVNAARWRSLSLRINEPFMGDPLLHMFVEGFQYPTPNLESLALYINAADEYFQPEGGPLHDLPALKHLILDAGGHLGYLKFAPKSIRTLCFRLWGSTHVMHPFTNLRNLSIVNWLNAGISHANDAMLTFPFLDCLTLKWQWHTLRPLPSAGDLPRKIQAPLLTTLRLLDDVALSSVADTDAFHHIRTLDLLGASTTQLTVFIDAQLPNYTALTTLTVCPWHLETTRSSLRLLKFLGKAPVGLNLLYSVLADKEGVMLDEENIATVVPAWRLPNEFIYRTHALCTCTIQ